MSQTPVAPRYLSQISSRPSLNVVLLTGVDPHVLAAVNFSLLDGIGDRTAIGVSYAVRPDPDAELGIRVLCRVSAGTGFDCEPEPTVESFPVEGCCLTCSIKHHLAALMPLLDPREGDLDYALVSLPVGLEAAPVASYLRELSACGELGRAIAAISIVDAVDVDGFERHFFDDDYLRLCGTDDENSVFDERSTGAVVSRLLRECDHVLQLPAAQKTFDRHADAAAGVNVDRLIGEIVGSECRVHRDAYLVDLPSLVEAGVSSGVS